MDTHEVILFNVCHLLRCGLFKPLSLISFSNTSRVAVFVRVFARDEDGKCRKRHSPCRLSIGTPSLFIIGAGIYVLESSSIIPFVFAILLLGSIRELIQNCQLFVRFNTRINTKLMRSDRTT